MGTWLAEDITIHLVNIYAPCDPKEQKALWEEVKGWMKAKPLDLWCVCGDFNSILHTNERKGRGRYQNNKGIRIDRFLLSSRWCNRWPNAKQFGLKRSISDHAPIILDDCQPEFWGPIPFKMVNWWLDREDFRILVSKFWQETVIEEIEEGGSTLIESLVDILK
ncbi:hypothetical protein ACS0TY_025266 [Phlomoides rotata]